MIDFLISVQVHSCPKKRPVNKQSVQNGSASKGSTINTKNKQKRPTAFGFRSGNATECYCRRVVNGPRVRVVGWPPSTSFPSSKAFAFKFISGQCSQSSSLEDVHVDLVNLDLHCRRRVEENIWQTWFGKDSMEVFSSCELLSCTKSILLWLRGEKIV